MKTCVDCKTPETKGDDSTTLNVHSRCRKCHKLKSVPRPWKKQIGDGFIYGCYFPYTDLNITEMARPGTGCPKDVEWLT